MLVQSENYPPGRSRPAALPPGILDSPTLARVERAMLRHEGTNREGQDLLRAQYTQSLLSNNYGKESVHAIKRGLLWQQRDKLFSRWKERYFILTRDYLHCFRRASGSDRISEMGQFLFKVKLIDVERVEWENKKTYSTVALILGRDGKIYLRAADGLEDWFELLEECMLTSKERRRALRCSHDGRPRDNNNITTTLDEWLAARQKIPMGRLPTDSVSTRQDTVKRREWTPREEEWEHPTLDNRLSRKNTAAIQSKRGRKRKWFFVNKYRSPVKIPTVKSGETFGSMACDQLQKGLLDISEDHHNPRNGSDCSSRNTNNRSQNQYTVLTDIDINSYDDSTLGTPSVTSYRMNQDVLCIQPPSLRTQGSFRSTRDTANSSSKRNISNPPETQCQFKFRERSYSDIQHVERKPWRALVGRQCNN